MDIVQAVENIRQHLETFAAEAKAKLEQELPVAAAFANAAASNPAFVALSSAVHLNAMPEVLQLAADYITKLDQTIGAAKAAGAAELQAQQAAAAAPAPPAA